MHRIKSLATCLFYALMLSGGQATWGQQLAKTPPMGWNSWNAFEAKINDSLIRAIADAMVSSGMRDAGYEYLVLDDGWMAPERDQEGRLQADPVKFPHGMKAIGDYIHSKGLKFGIYECRGYLTCQRLPGSFQHEEIDMATFAAWGVDYIKLDACYAEKNGRLTTEDLKIYRDAIDKTGRPMILSISDFGNGAWAWGGKNFGQLWRTSYDIYPFIENVYHHANTSGGDLRIHPAFNGLWQFAGPGHWNDPDMLEVGNLASDLEDRVHMSLWCILAAPLMAGNDLRNMSDRVTAVLTAREILAVNQDPAGIQGYKIFDNGKQVVYNKPLSDGTTAVLMYNMDSIPADITVKWGQTGLTGVQPVRDLWAGKELGRFKDQFTGYKLPQHGHLMLKVGKPRSEMLPLPAPVPDEKYVPSTNGFTFLSDLYYIMKYGQAPGYDLTPEGKQIRMQGKVYEKGLSCADGTILIYKLKGNSQKFRALVGLDESCSDTLKGRFRILNEDAFGNRVLFDSGIMTKDSMPKQVNIDVKGIDCLFLKFDGKGATGDWAQARAVGSWDEVPVTFETAYIDSLIRQMELIPIEVNGDKDNRINIVILNRWEARDRNPYNRPELRNEFIQDVEASLHAAFTPEDPRAHTVYANYHKFFNLYALWWPGAPEWKTGDMDSELVDAVRDRLFLPWKDPNTGWVTVLMMPNREGGGGGAARNLERRTGNAVIVGNAIGKMLHEISHTCSSIGDEYTAGATGTDAIPVYNTTTETNRERIPWRAWIDPATPVPTPYTIEFKDKVGIFEGSQYHLTNYYRSSAQGCIMGAGVFDNTEEMCVVCSQRISMRVYALVNPLEEVWPPESTIRIANPSRQKFSVKRVHPEPDTQVTQWILNGQLIAGGTDEIYLDIQPGQSYELVFTLRDTTGFIREDPPFGEFPYREHRWIINPEAGDSKSGYEFRWTSTVPGSPAGKRYEAEEAKATQGHWNQEQLAGSSGQTYVKSGPAAGSIDWRVNCRESGIYELKFVYASGQKGNLALSLEINGEVSEDQIAFLETRPLYSGWDDATAQVRLLKGENLIRLVKKDSSLIHLDYLWLPDQPVPEVTAALMPDLPDQPDGPRQQMNLARKYRPDRVKSARLLLWLDAGDLDGNGITDTEVPPKGPFEGWKDKASGNRGPMIKYYPNSLNHMGTAGFDMVWVSNMEKPVNGFQTVIMVYKQSSMSFPGTAPFKGLNRLVDLDTFPPDKDFHVLVREFVSRQNLELKTTEGNWEGSLAEIIVYDGLLSGREKESVKTGLIKKWSLMNQ